MDKNKSLMLAAVIFGVIALLHLMRAVFGWDLRIGGWHVPVWLSYIAAVVAGYLSWHMYKAGKK